MLGNWIKATSTDLSSPYTLAAVSGFPAPGDVFGADRAIGYMAEVVGGANEGNLESGVGHIDGEGKLAVDAVLATWNGTTYTRNGSAVTKTGASSISIIVWPDLQSVPVMFNTLVAGAAVRAIPSLNATGFVTSSFGWTNLSRIHYFGHLLAARIDCDGIYYRGGTSNSSDINIGLYSMGRDGFPNRRLAETGAVTHATGSQEVAWSGAAVLSLAPGWYYLGAVTDNTDNLFYRCEIGANPIGLQNGLVQAILTENVSGVTLPAVAGASVFGTNRTNVPTIGLRASG